MKRSRVDFGRQVFLAHLLQGSWFCNSLAFDVGEVLALVFESQSSSAEVSVGVIDRRHKPAQLFHEDHGSDTGLERIQSKLESDYLCMTNHLGASSGPIRRHRRYHSRI